MNTLVENWRYKASQLTAEAEVLELNGMSESATVKRVRSDALSKCAEELEAAGSRGGGPSAAHVPIYHGRQWPVGLANAAKRIGVSKGHLYHVLKGVRKSPSVSARYQALVEELKTRPAADL